MAVSGHDGLWDQVTCPECREQFNNTDHVPKILPCEHTFCDSCLNSLSARKRKVECPKCEKEHKVPARGGFTTNRALINCGDALRHYEQQPLLLKGISLMYQGIWTVLYACINVVVTVLRGILIYTGIMYAYNLIDVNALIHGIIRFVKHVYTTVKDLLSRVMPSCSVVVIAFLLLSLLDFVTPSKEKIYTNYVIIGMVYACNVLFLYPVAIVISACSVAIAALQILCLQVIEFIKPSEHQVCMCIYYVICCVIYTLKVVIVYSPLVMLGFVEDSPKFRLAYVLDREFEEWLGQTFAFSYFYLALNCITYLLMTVLQFVFSSYVDSYFKSDVIFLLIYCCIVLILWIVLYYIDSRSNRPMSAADMFRIYCFHILTHFIVSFDWYKVLLQMYGITA